MTIECEKKGIDISSWQSTLDLHIFEGDKKKPEFVIVRIGGADGSNGLYEDNSWRKFYMACKAMKIPVGAYWFGTNTVDIIEQIKYCTNLLRDTQFDYPIFLDVEHDSLMKLPKSKLTDYVVDFCSSLETAGYYVGIYASASTWHYNFDNERLKRFDYWPAIWNNKPNAEGMTDWQLWQIGTEEWHGWKLDTNICYKDYKVIAQLGFNNFD